MTVQKYLPPISSYSKDYLKDLLSERKDCLNVADVKQINVPFYPELNVKDIYDAYKDDKVLSRYLPSGFAKGRQIDRTWFFNVLNSLFPD